MVNRKNLRRKTGFTLLELLVTMGIVSTLASLGVATYEEYRGKAEGAEFNIVFNSMRTAYQGRNDQTVSNYRRTYRFFGNSLVEQSTTMDQLAPGISYNKNYFYYYTFERQSCLSGTNCLVDYVFLADCRPRGPGYRYWRTYANGNTVDVNWYDYSGYASYCPEEY